VLASSTLTLSPSASTLFTRLKSLTRGADTLLAYKILCVRFTCVVHDSSSIPTEASLSVTGVTLDTGGWLALTRPGLAPGKKRQASLGALTNKRLSGLRANLEPPGGTGPSRADQINVCWTNPRPARRQRRCERSLKIGDCIFAACPAGHCACANPGSEPGKEGA
jgi:hypothetical protein